MKHQRLNKRRNKRRQRTTNQEKQKKQKHKSKQQRIPHIHSETILHSCCLFSFFAHCLTKDTGSLIAMQGLFSSYSSPPFCFSAFSSITSTFWLLFRILFASQTVSLHFYRCPVAPQSEKSKNHLVDILSNLSTRLFFFRETAVLNVDALKKGTKTDERKTKHREFVASHDATQRRRFKQFAAH